MQHVFAPRTYVMVFAVLILLTVATVGLSFLSCAMTCSGGR